jgi:putative GTP pyrophosphokinase
MLAIFAIMQRKIHIARFLLVVSFMFTMVFQFVHSLEHAVNTSRYAKEHANHTHFIEKRSCAEKTFEWKVNHHSLEKCFACDMIPSTAVVADITSVDFLHVEINKKVQDDVVQQFIPLSHVYYSLRAPPATV